MERDPKLSKLIRESGVVPAPGGFTAGVMARIDAVPEKKAYKPIVGRGGRIIILLFVIGIIAFSVFYSDQSGELIGISNKLSQVEWQWPQLSFNLDFLQEVNISTGVVSALVALFILILSDAGLSRHRRLT